MPRRRLAIALLALAALWGTRGAAGVEASPRAVETAAEPSLAGLERANAGASTGIPRDATPTPTTAFAGATLAASVGGRIDGPTALEAWEELPGEPAPSGAAEQALQALDEATREAAGFGEGLGDEAAVPDALEAWDERAAAPWVARIEDRLAALHEAAQAHLGRRPAQAAASDALSRRLTALAAGLHDPAALGIAVRDLDTGAPVFEHDAERGLNPASNQKLLTAVAALELLGDDYRWQTRVLRAGDALVLRGEGDPSLQSADLERLAAEVAAAIDLHEIRRVIVDDTAFSPRRFGPGYDAEGTGASYMAPSGALSLQWSTIEVRVRGAAKGRPVQVEVSPRSEHVEVRSTATGGRGGIRVQSWAEGERTVVAVDGHLRRGQRYTKRRRVSDPGRFAGSTFAAMLAERGAAGQDGGHLPVELGPTPAGAMPLATHTSAPLPQVLDSALSWSNNFTSEQILRTLGWRMSGEPGDWKNGRRALERYWEAAGLSRHALEFENASGLSARGRISAAALADLLAFAARDGSAAAALWSALPVAGREGTVRSRLRRSGGRVRAKTGTLHDASALSGVVQARGGRRLGFSILVNGPVAPDRSRRLQDAVVMALLDYDARG